MSTQYWGIELQVNTTTAGNQTAPQIAALRNGGFVVFWETGVSGAQSIQGQLFDAAGHKVGSEFAGPAVAGSNEDVHVTETFNGFGISWTNDPNGLGNANSVYHQPTPQMVRPLVLRRPSRH